MEKFEDAIAQVDRLIWKISHRWAESIRGVEASDLHQEGLIRLYEVYTDSRYSLHNAATLKYIFLASLKNMFADMFDKSRTEAKYIQQIDLQEESDKWGYEAFTDVYTAYLTQHLTRQLSDDAASLLELLLAPSPPVHRLHNLICMRRRALRLQGINVKIPGKISNETTGHALGFTKTKTKLLMRELRQAWKNDFQTRYNFKLSEPTSLAT